MILNIHLCLKIFLGLRKNYFLSFHPCEIHNLSAVCTLSYASFAICHYVVYLVANSSVMVAKDIFSELFTGKMDF